MSSLPQLASPAAESILGVGRSILGRRWIGGGGDDRLGLALAQRLQVPEIVGRMMAARGVDLDGAANYLNPTLRELLPDPSRLAGMDAAAARLAAAIRGGEPVAVFGDYDVDGGTSAALLHRFFAAVGARLRIYIPDRLTEGYGPNLPALLKLKAEGIGLLVTVDCGTTAFAPLEGAARAGLDVIVVDHHTAEPSLPAAAAVVNPNRLDDSSGCGQLAAVGVAFLLAVALNRALRASGWYGAARPEPDLKQWLDLVALGTVCDVVPLTGVNRALVAQGLKVLAGRGNPGLAALADRARLSEAPTAYHAGYVLGPRINAGGRVGQADLGARLLSTDDPTVATEIAERLEILNAERRAIEQAVLADAIARVESGGGAEGRDAPFLLVAGEGWHPGVIGIVAARLKERYNRSAAVAALENGVAKGSARSVRGFDIGSAVIAARQAGLLISGGGHAMAAGFTVTADNIAPLRDFIAERAGARGADGLAPVLKVDAVLSARGASVEIAQLIERLGPFGSGNPEPRLVIPDLRILRADVVGENHVRAILGGADGTRLKAIAFRSLEGDLGPALLGMKDAPLHMAGHLRVDSWQGRTGVQFLIDDAAPATG
jgi:single-stranded-DNA-specific exonuclease